MTRDEMRPGMCVIVQVPVTTTIDAPGILIRPSATDESAAEVSLEGQAHTVPGAQIRPTVVVVR
jgi:hypothetical protein